MFDKETVKLDKNVNIINGLKETFLFKFFLLDSPFLLSVLDYYFKTTFNLFFMSRWEILDNFMFKFI